MVYWFLLPLLLALPFSQAYEDVQIPFFAAKKKNRIGKAHDLLRHHPLIDAHNDFPMILAFFKDGKINQLNITHIDHAQTDIERLRKGQVAGQFWSIYYECESKENQLLKALEAIDVTKRMVDLYPETFKLVTSTKQFKKAFKHGRIGSMLGMEGGQMIDSSMAALRSFYGLGVRYMTLTHNCHTPWAESCCDPNPPPFERGMGLTAFGRKIVLEMNRIGMMVDISHVSHAAMHAVLDTTRAPVIFSHSSSHSLCSIERNVPDIILERLYETDGVVMVNFISDFVQCDPKKNATLSDVADHIEHIASVAGRHRVGLGADYGMDDVTKELGDVSKYPKLFAELISRGWSDKELVGLAGENILRVWKHVELVKDMLSKELPEESRINDKSQ
ncbi:dipeptidase 1 precursor [Spinellus fusiger]|nr:dipeptidase 1 precursor [Spinellus fusiger]